MSANRFLVDLPSGSIEGLTLGVGRPTVLLHGFPETPEFWLPFVSQFQGSKWILPWLPGLQGSQAHGEFSLQKAARLIIELIEYQSEQTDLVGFDWGGGLSWFTKAFSMADSSAANLGHTYILASAFPATLKQLIVTDPEQKRRSAYMTYFTRPDFSQKLIQSDFKVFAIGLPAGFISTQVDMFERAKIAWAHPSYANSIGNFYSELLADENSWQAALGREILFTDLTWVWLENDEFFVDKNLEIAPTLGVERVVRIPGATHFSHLADPVGFAASIQSHLRL